MTRNKFIAPMGIVVITVICITVMSSFRPKAEQRRQPTEPLLPIQVVELQLQDHQLILPSRGIVAAKTVSTLAAQVAGNIVAVSEQMRSGGYFNKGDWLMTIDPRDYETALKLAEANRQKARLALQEEKARGLQAKRDWRRLSRGKEASTLVLREPQLASAVADLSSMQAQWDKASLDLERSRILAPFNGRVISQDVDLGHYVNAGTQLGQIIGSDVMEVSLPISADWRPLLDLQAQNIRVQLHSDIGDSRQNFVATVVRQSAVIDAQSRQLLLIAQITPPVTNTLKQPQSELVNGQWQLQVGDYVSASLYGRSLSDVFVLPREALIDGRYVWAVEQLRLYKKPVNVLWSDEKMVVINQGLAVGDIINITPLAYVVSGSKVRILPDNKATSSMQLSRQSEAQINEGVVPVEADGERS